MVSELEREPSFYFGSSNMTVIVRGRCADGLLIKMFSDSYENIYFGRCAGELAERVSKESTKTTGEINNAWMTKCSKRFSGAMEKDELLCLTPKANNEVKICEPTKVRATKIEALAMSCKMRDTRPWNNKCKRFVNGEYLYALIVGQRSENKMMLISIVDGRAALEDLTDIRGILRTLRNIMAGHNVVNQGEFIDKKRYECKNVVQRADEKLDNHKVRMRDTTYNYVQGALRRFNAKCSMNSSNYNGSIRVEVQATLKDKFKFSWIISKVYDEEAVRKNIEIATHNNQMAGTTTITMV